MKRILFAYEAVHWTISTLVCCCVAFFLFILGTAWFLIRSLFGKKSNIVEYNCSDWPNEDY